jgi:quercetin dioxygenase-like cupin family protein
MTAEGFVRGPGEGDARWMYGNLVLRKVLPEETLGQYAVMEFTSPQGFSTGTHRHAGEDETYYVLEGAMSGKIGDRAWTAGPGDVVFIPRDTPHDFTVDGESPARFIVIVGPPNFDAEVESAPPAESLTLPPRGGRSGGREA